MALFETTFGSLSLVEPTDAEVAANAEALAAWYSDPENMRLMTASGPMTPAEVKEFYRDLCAQGGRVFLIFDSGDLVGDADFRNIRGEIAEFAIMIGPSDRQGKGIGTAAAAALHHFAFTHLGIRRVVLSVARFNERALRLYARLGYEPDFSPDAAACAEHPDDVTMSLNVERFDALWAGAVTGIRVIARNTCRKPNHDEW